MKHKTPQDIENEKLRKEIKDLRRIVETMNRQLRLVSKEAHTAHQKSRALTEQMKTIDGKVKIMSRTRLI